MKTEFKPAFTAVDGLGGTDGCVPFAIRQAPTNLSFVEDHEEAEAQKLIDDQFRALTKSEEYPEGTTFREQVRLARHFIAVRIHVRDEELKSFTDPVTGEVRKLFLPEVVRAEDKYQSCCGVVIGLGPDSFMNKDGTPRGSRYKLCDWIVFPRTDIIRIDFHGVPIGILTDDRAIAVTTGPEHWVPGILKYKV